MTIERVIIKNYRALRNTDISFGDHFNIIVGDNEVGKSTLFEAINLALKCQINRRPAAYELHPFLFNRAAVSEFLTEMKAGCRNALTFELWVEPYDGEEVPDIFIGIFNCGV